MSGLKQIFFAPGATILFVLKGYLYHKSKKDFFKLENTATVLKPLVFLCRFSTFRFSIKCCHHGRDYLMLTVYVCIAFLKHLDLVFEP